MTSTYTHSGKSPRWRTLAVAAVTAALLYPVAWSYGYGQLNLNSLVVGAMLPVVFGFAVGMINTVALRTAKVRNEGTARKMVTRLSLWAYYAHWASYLALAVSKSGASVTMFEAVTSPITVLSTVWSLLSEGVWELFDVEIKGIPLLIIWGIEGGIILALGRLLPLHNFEDTPFCETCQRWCKKDENVVRFRSDETDGVLTMLRDGDLERLAAVDRVPLTAEEGGWLQCDIESCSQCRETITLDVHTVHGSRNRKGEVSKRSTQVISNQRLTPNDAAKLRELGAAQLSSV
jgi:hypothetical protein